MHASTRSCRRFSRGLSRTDLEHSRRIALSEHVEHCLTCQAELARHTRLLSLLGELRHDVSVIAPGALETVLDRLGQRAERHVLRAVVARRRVSVVPMLFVLVAAAAMMAWRRTRASSAHPIRA